jgi:hypothetical protein
MNKRRFRSFIAPAPWLMAAGILLMPAAAQPQCSVAYSGLEGALGIVQSNTGNLLVTESGSPISFTSPMEARTSFGR